MNQPQQNLEGLTAALLASAAEGWEAEGLEYRVQEGQTEEAVRQAEQVLWSTLTEGQAHENMTKEGRRRAHAEPLAAAYRMIRSRIAELWDAVPDNGVKLFGPEKFILGHLNESLFVEDTLTAEEVDGGFLLTDWDGGEHFLKVSEVDDLLVRWREEAFNLEVQRVLSERDAWNRTREAGWEWPDAERTLDNSTNRDRLATNAREFAEEALRLNGVGK